MPRGPTPGWNQRRQPVLDDYVLASIHEAGGKHDAKGHYAELVIAGCASAAEAREQIRALHRSARYLVRWRFADVGIHAVMKRSGAGYDVHFHAVDKAFARQSVIDRYGPDRSKWPYDPRRRGPQ